MTDLQFERIAQIIAIAAVGGTDKGISVYFVKAGEIKIRFSEYVKSQIHLNVVHGLYNRSLKEYVETLYFLQGRTSRRASALRVLGYFYDDLANFLINNGNDIKLSIVVDTELFDLERVTLSIDELKDDLLKNFDRVSDESIPIGSWEYSTILDFVEDANDVRNKASSYALAYALKMQRSESALKIIESR